jgi:hypothetical protein
MRREGDTAAASPVSPARVKNPRRLNETPDGSSVPPLLVGRLERSFRPMLVFLSDIDDVAY